MTNDEIQNIFFLECEEALGQAEEGLLACRSGTADADTVNGIFRAVHSIKGGAGAFSFSLLQAFIHKFETVLSYVRDEELGLSEALNTLMLRAFDILADHVAAVRGEGDTPDDAAISAELEDVAAKAAAGVPVFDEPAESACDEPAEPAQDDGTATDDLGLDFDLDGLMGDLSVDEEQAAAMEAAAAEVERSMDERDAARVTKAAAKLAAENASGDEHHGWRVYVRFLDGALGNGSEPLLMLRELEEMGALCLAADASAIPTLDALDVEKAYLSWTFFVPAHIEKSAIEEVFDFINNECELKIEVLHAPVARDTIEVRLPHIAAATPKKPKANTAPATTATSITPASQTAPAAHPAKVALVETPAPVAPAAPAAARTAASVGQTVRVDLAKLDKLIDTVGELVIAQAMMAQRLASHGLNSIDEMGMLDLLTRDIQESTMSIRAQPIGSVFSRVPRIVRELEADTGKRVVLTMSGEATELDKTVVERLGEPLTHLIRNAVDHGIEKPDVRLVNGKPAEGKLHLSAEQRSGRIVISLSDDGAGINREVVLQKAIEKGLVAPGTQLSNEEIDHLIFAPGFSTADKVSNISGRGVGMDVVRQNVKDLGGRISIESHPGKGCTFTLALPLTLAIADGMIVTVGDQTVVIPLTHVLESLRPEQADVQHIGKDLMVLNNRGKFLPIVRLDHAVGALGAADTAQDAVLIVVDTESHGQAVLMVDSIVDQRQFVIKSLEAHYQPVTGVAGATILGDGKVALILDVDSLVADNFAHHGSALAA
ncbi:MAG: chemotaxis protein CheA [Sphingobium sp.]|nr:chemotaxis protein CheA [Sphingobium sp.]MBP6111645.1 chemotaxis protein CheA [Sphingobium sp.]MBP8671220.1 chemotaxis protein CheA [Sphingobium sp.]MBP9158195.1 chemotaxis protein CheA [Sphingobium sp.]